MAGNHLAVLHIGAENTKLGKALRRYNPDLKVLCLCGRKRWFLQGLLGIPLPEAARQIERELKGTYKIKSRLADFGLPERSLHLVVLDGPGPEEELAGLKGQLEKCLGPGGVFARILLSRQLQALPRPHGFTQLEVPRFTGDATPVSISVQGHLVQVPPSDAVQQALHIKKLTTSDINKARRLLEKKGLPCTLEDLEPRIEVWKKFH